MSYDVVTTKRFDKALKRCVKRGLEMSKLTTAIGILAREGSLPAIFTLLFIDTGTHSDLF